MIRNRLILLSGLCSCGEIVIDQMQQGGSRSSCTICRNTQDQERTDAVRQTCKSQIQIWKQKFLGTRLLRGYGGKNEKMIAN